LLQEYVAKFVFSKVDFIVLLGYRTCYMCTFTWWSCCYFSCSSSTINNNNN